MIVEITANKFYLPGLNESEFSLEDSIGRDTERDKRKTFDYDGIKGTGNRKYASPVLCVNDQK